MTDPGSNKREMDADFAVAARTRIDVLNRERERLAAKRSRWRR